MVCGSHRFFSDFSNKAENCSNAAPCSNGATSGSFVTGEAVIQGLELQVGSVVDLSAGVTMPFDLAYTLSNAEISKTNDNFNSGDRLASGTGADFKFARRDYF